MSKEKSDRQEKVVAFLRAEHDKGGRVHGFTRNEIAEAIGLPADDIIASLRGLCNRKVVNYRKTKGGLRAPLRYHLNAAAIAPEA